MAIDILLDGAHYPVPDALPLRLLNDKEVALHLVRYDYGALSYANEEIKADKDVVLKTLTCLEKQIEDTQDDPYYLPWDQAGHLDHFLNDVISGALNPTESSYMPF